MTGVRAAWQWRLPVFVPLHASCSGADAVLAGVGAAGAAPSRELEHGEPVLVVGPADVVFVQPSFCDCVWSVGSGDGFFVGAEGLLEALDEARHLRVLVHGDAGPWVGESFSGLDDGFI